MKRLKYNKRFKNVKKRGIFMIGAEFIEKNKKIKDYIVNEEKFDNISLILLFLSIALISLTIILFA